MVTIGEVKTHELRERKKWEVNSDLRSEDKYEKVYLGDGSVLESFCFLLVVTNRPQGGSLYFLSSPSPLVSFVAFSIIRTIRSQCS